jgi:16S rRNA (adenine1518-N6/adenine1519-N6)-dimethyltransferase
MTRDAQRIPPPATPPEGGRFSLRQTRALLATIGCAPRKPLGQNFLVDGNIVAKSLQLASVGAGDTVVEIGPGLGTLTAALLTAGATVFTVERDATLARHLRGWLAPLFAQKFFLKEGDAVDFPLAGLEDAAGTTAPAIRAELNAVSGFKVVANLPYAISTPWLDAVLRAPVLPVEMVVMLQREAAERFCATEGKHVGAISIALAAAFEIAPGHKVPARCFFPPPRVDSVLLHLRRRAEPRRFLPETRRILRTLFLHRRKQLASTLRMLPQTPALAAWLKPFPQWGLTREVRPEKVPFALWFALDDAVAAEG